MKKLILGAVTALFFAVPAAQADVSIDLSGEVPLVCEVSLSSGASSATVLMTNTADNQAIMSLVYLCNDPDGIDVDLSSLNGELDGPGTFDVAYSILQEGDPGCTVASADASTYSPGPVDFFSFLQDGDLADDGLACSFKVNLDTAAAVAGTYTDTLSFTVTPL